MLPEEFGVGGMVGEVLVDRAGERGGEGVERVAGDGLAVAAGGAGPPAHPEHQRLGRLPRQRLVEHRGELRAHDRGPRRAVVEDPAVLEGAVAGVEGDDGEAGLGDAELRDDAKRLRDIVALFDDAPLSPQLETEIASLKNLSDLFEEAAEILVKKGTDYALQKHAGRL